MIYCFLGGDSSYGGRGLDFAADSGVSTKVTGAEVNDFSSSKDFNTSSSLMASVESSRRRGKTAISANLR